MNKKLLFSITLIFIAIAIIYNIVHIKLKLQDFFYNFLVKEEVNKIKAIIDSALISGADPVQALVSYLDSSKLLVKCQVHYKDKVFIYPKEKVKFTHLEEIKIAPFKFKLFFNFNLLKDFQKYLFSLFILTILLILVFLYVLSIFLKQLKKQTVQLKNLKEQEEHLKEINLMIRSIVHEIKNRLNVLNLLFYKVKNKIPQEEQKIIHEQIQKLANYIQETANLRKEIKLNLKDVNLNEIISSVLNLYEEHIKNSNIDLEVKIFDFNVKADFENLHIVFSNIIKNAIEALANIDNPQIKILMKKDKNYLKLLIKDNAAAIQPAKIFTPLFTTKEKGFGLGLYHSWRIIKAHGWLIKAYLENNYSVFEISIPC